MFHFLSIIDQVLTFDSVIASEPSIRFLNSSHWLHQWCATDFDAMGYIDSSFSEELTLKLLYIILWMIAIAISGRGILEYVIEKNRHYEDHAYTQTYDPNRLFFLQNSQKCLFTKKSKIAVFCLASKKIRSRSIWFTFPLADSYYSRLIVALDQAN